MPWNSRSIDDGAVSIGPGAVAVDGHGLFVCVYNNQQHFTHCDADGNIQDAWFGADGWRLRQINNANGYGSTVPDEYIASPLATAAAAGDLFVSVYNGQQHFAYRDANGHIQDVWHGAAGWSLQQINGDSPSVPGEYIASPNAPAAVADLFVSVYNGQQHFVYRDANGHIQDVWYGAGGWSLQQINGVSPSVPCEYVVLPNAPAAIADLFVSVYNGQQHFAYRDANGHIQDVWHGAGGWSLQQINGVGPSVPGEYVALPNAPALFADLSVSIYDDQQHFVYRDAHGHIQDAWYGAGGWSLQQVNGVSPSVPGEYVALPNAPAAFGDAFVSVYNDQQHFAYRDAHGHIRDAWYASGGWHLRKINNGTPWPGPAETFSIPALAIDGTSGDYEWGALAGSKVTFLTGCPSNAAFIAKCHSLSVLCFPYVTFTFGLRQIVPTPVYPIVSFPVLPATLYQGIDFASLPGSTFWAINASGGRTTSYASDGVGFTAKTLANVAGDPDSYPPGNGTHPDSYYTCPNVQAYQDELLRWIAVLLQRGADGIFIDAIPGSLNPCPCLLACYGDQPIAQAQYQHTHIYNYNPSDPVAAAAAQQKAFTLLMQRVRVLVRSHGGRVLGNTGLQFQFTLAPDNFTFTFPPGSLDPFIYNGVLPYLDADMMESFLNLTSLEVSPTKTVQHRWKEYWYAYIQAVQGVIQRKSVLVITPVPYYTSLLSEVYPPSVWQPGALYPTVRDYHFLAYATAKLAGFIPYTGQLSAYNGDLGSYDPNGPCPDPATYQQLVRVAQGCDEYADLYRVRLGAPITPALNDAESIVYYRVFENGMVVINSDMTAAHTLTVAPPIPATKFFDLFDLHGSYGITRLEVIDVSTTGGVLTLPPLSGRVYLFAADTTYLLGT